MNYLGIVERLISATTEQENLISLNFAREGLKAENVNQLPETEAQKRFVYYLRGINKELNRTGKD
nr:hypothetical protein [Enterococcus innesii]